jgi:S1-C subfamily serine protease
MTASTTRIVIRHLSGSKINQIEQFDLDGLQEITIGRDPGSRIAYDLQRDDEVSRKHAVIRIKNDREVYFRIADLNSSNGTFLNGERVGGEVELLPDDIVELGRSGPKFIFDVQPRPANLPSRTRQMGTADAAATRILAPTPEAGATVERVSAADTRQRTAGGDTAAMAKVPIGRATIQRLLFDERRKASRVWIGLTAAIVVLAVAGGGALYWHNRSVGQQLQQELAAATARADAIRAETDEKLTRQLGITPTEIKRLGDSTVYIDNIWQLYDWQTNRPIYQRMTRVDGKLLPCYVRIDDNTVVRWLTLEQNKDDVYKPVGKRQSGSGFVIGEQGFILTNKHVAAGWAARYDDFHFFDWTDGVVYNLDERPSRHRLQRVSNIDTLTKWVPESGGYIFEPNRPHAISNDQRRFYGRNDRLTIQFPGTRIDFNASLLRTSIDADIAEIKIESATPLSKLELAPDNAGQVGEKIILLGYPDVSQETFAVQSSNEGGLIRKRAVYIPEPTVTVGVIAKMPTKREQKNDGDVTTFGTTGDTYQLDIFAGPGSSGGPVLNKDGKVIGLLSFGITSAEHVSFAVPVSYVRELLQAQRSASP